MEKCIHQLGLQDCFYCSGEYYKKIEEKKRRVYGNSELKEKYETLKEKFSNFREVWSEEEIFVVYDNFKSLSKKEYRDMVFKVAIYLERTKNAINWMNLHLFSERIDLHRGKEVQNFRQKYELLKV